MPPALPPTALESKTTRRVGAQVGWLADKRAPRYAVWGMVLNLHSQVVSSR